MEKVKKFLNVNTIFPIVLLILEGYWYKLTFDVPVGAGDAGTAGTNVSFPRFVLCVMLVCTIVIFVQELAKAGRAQAKESDPAARMDAIKVVIMAVALVAYVALFDTVGFILSTICIMLLAGVLFGQRNKVLLISISILFPIFLYLVFRFALKIMLPTLIL